MVKPIPPRPRGADRSHALLKLNGKPQWSTWHKDGIDLIDGPPWQNPVVLQSSSDHTALNIEAFLPPCGNNKVVGLAFNYKSLVGSRGQYEEPLVFLKGANALTGHASGIPMPVSKGRCWIEVELAIVLGRQARHVNVTEAAACIAGFTIANDITTDNIQGRDHHLALSKSQDGFCPLGPWLVPDLDTANLNIKAFVDGNQVQRGNTADRVCGDAQAVALASRYFSLEAGDVIVTGTCSGWEGATFSAGAQIAVEIEGLGTLENHILPAPVPQWSYLS